MAEVVAENSAEGARGRLRAAIRSGVLKPGERLPSTRSLASQLSTSRGTIDLAYGVLASEGHVVGRGAAGTVVASHGAAVPRIHAMTSAQSDAASVAPFRMGLPALDAFRPQLIFVSAGFDAHFADEMGGLRWTETDYAWITSRIAEVAAGHCGGRIVSTLEGGYSLPHLARSVAAHVRELAGA